MPGHDYHIYYLRVSGTASGTMIVRPKEFMCRESPPLLFMVPTNKLTWFQNGMVSESMLTRHLGSIHDSPSELVHVLH